MSRYWIEPEAAFNRVTRFLAVRPAWQRAAPTLVLIVLVMALVAAVLLRTSVVWPRSTTFTVVSNTRLYKQDDVWDLHLRDRYRQWSMPGYDPQLVLAGANPFVDITYGYAIAHDAGPVFARSWIGREHVWIRTYGLAENRTPPETRLAEVLKELSPRILADPRLVGRTIGITLQNPDRWWINWRGVSGWFATAVAVLCGIVLLFLVIVLRAARSRHMRVACGRCPACAYEIRGLDIKACPECGTQLTEYEQTVLAAMRHE